MQNRSYNPDYMEKLKYNNNIVSVISKYVTLKNKGKLYWGCCPFHHEKTPSFAVNELEGYYHCFGCGESGDVVEFIKKIESVDFMSAVKILADNANMELPEYAFDESLIKQKKLKEQVLNALNLANKHYISNLKDSVVALNYIKKRGLTAEIVKKFELGYSKDWTSLVSYLKHNNISESVMKEAGLIDQKNGNSAPFDTMAKRLTFPIKDSFNNVIGFSCRSLDENPNFAKYKNTQQTVVFNKSNVIYGIQFVKERKNAGTLNEVIIVEGQMDVIGMHSAGFTNAVATMGTALTSLHGKQLKRFTNKVVLCFDGDSAGIKATLKAIDVLKGEDLEIYVASLPEGLDPDEYIKKYSAEKMQELINNAVSMYDYLILTSAKKYNLNDNLQLTKYVKEALNYLVNIQAESEREPYLKQIYKITNISLEILKRDMQNLISPSKNVLTRETFKAAILTDNVFKAQMFIIASMLFKKPYAKFVEINEFNNFTLEYIYNYIKNCYENDKLPIISSIFNEEIQKDETFEQIINYEFSDENLDAKYFHDCEKILELDKLYKQQAVVTSLMTDATNIEDRKKYAIKLQEITKLINQKKSGD